MTMRQSKQAQWPAAFAANFRAWCSAMQVPPVGMIECRVDRALIAYSDDWYRFLRDETLFAQWDFRIKEHNPLMRDQSGAMWGVREKTPWASAQCIVHADREIGSFIEIDFDLGNPERGAFPALIHFGEYLRYRAPQVVGRKKASTNPFIVRRWLRRRGIGVRTVVPTVSLPDPPPPQQSGMNSA